MCYLLLQNVFKIKPCSKFSKKWCLLGMPRIRTIFITKLSFFKTQNACYADKRYRIVLSDVISFLKIKFEIYFWIEQSMSQSGSLGRSSKKVSCRRIELTISHVSHIQNFWGKMFVFSNVVSYLSLPRYFDHTFFYFIRASLL